MKFVKLAFVAGLVAALSVPAFAQQGTATDPFRDPALAALKGKKIAYLPISLGFDMANAWGAIPKLEAQKYGQSFSVRDPNWNTDAMAQALTSMIAEKPDVIVTQNPDLQSLARLLRQANAQGIYVIQVNMQGVVQTDAFVGPDFVAIGEQEGEIIGQACGKSSGKSGKIAIVQGVLTGGVSFFQVQGIEKALAKYPEIKVVSKQAADWDASKSRAITETVLQQNPDLCAVIDVWDGQARGSAAAIQQAGKRGKVLLVTSGGGAQGMCDALNDGSFDVAVNYDAAGMGRDIATTIKMLLQAKPKPGSMKFQAYSPTKVLRKADVKPGSCWNADEFAKVLK